jgi:hypothetical protein
MLYQQGEELTTTGKMAMIRRGKESGMSGKSLGRIEKRIEKIKDALAELGPMRPGSLTRQYKDPKTKSGPYWQVSYTRAMRSRSDYVRSERVTEVRKEIAEYQRFKKLTNEWIDLSIEASKLRVTVGKKKEKG